MYKSTMTAFLLIPFLVPATLVARPGGGGGFPGGGYRPVRPVAPVARPPRPAPAPRPSTLPAHPGVTPRPIGAGGPGAIRPRPTTLPAHPGGKPGVADIGKFLGGQPPGHFPGTPGHRPGYGYVHKAEFHTNITRHFSYHPSYGYPYSRAWCGHMGWHYQNWPYWTAAATGVTVGRWIGATYSGYGAAQAIPYYPVEPAPVEVYVQQVAAPAEVVAAGSAVVVPDDAELLNLGTFGLIPYQQNDIAYAVQLATTKDGIVRGLQWDMANNTSVEVEGSIEKDTYRIAWRAKGSNTPYFETNLDQLTQQESLVNVYNPTTKALISWQVIQIEEKDLPQQP